MLRDRCAFESIATYLSSPVSYHRGLAAQALGSPGDDRAIKPLTAMLSDQAVAWTEDHGPERTVAEIAQQALQELQQ
jgi:HEAT repeat protein